MTFLDRLLQRWRIRKTISYIPADSVVLDIGCHHGELFAALGTKLRYGVGLDPILQKDTTHERYELLSDIFPCNRVADKVYHCITMLAVFEHISPTQQQATAHTCYTHLHKDGLMILTVPGNRVDSILAVLRRLRLVEGMQLHEHYGFDVSRVIPIFSDAGFTLIAHKRFQLGLNNLFVFKKAVS